jgi:predicted CXXCH cytochrome family protein
MKKLLVVVVVLAIALTATVAMAGIVGSRHDLSSTGGSGQVAPASDSYSNDEICIWCHTPHSANAAGRPLWNKSVQSTAYTPYGPTINNATGVVTLSANGTTKACLSCHDGVNAINNLINYAGGGGVTATGTNVPFDGQALGTAVPMDPASSFLIGQDLRDDHPVGFAYDMTASMQGTTLNALPGTGGNIVKVTGVGTISGQAAATVECSSCHDPHGVVGTTAFLRISNSQSALCMACHTI